MLLSHGSVSVRTVKCSGIICHAILLSLPMQSVFQFISYIQITIRSIDIFINEPAILAGCHLKLYKQMAIKVYIIFYYSLTSTYFYLSLCSCYVSALKWSQTTACFDKWLKYCYTIHSKKVSSVYYHTT